MWPKNILMVIPNQFEIKYSINPYMKDNDGRLKVVDKNRAEEQWQGLKELYLDLGLRVETLPGVAGLPDMVFCANPFFPFMRGDRLQIILSRMNSPFRQKETEIIKEWALKKNIECYELPDDISFEGMGDALWNYESQEIYGGYGFRTDRRAYDHIEAITGRPVIRLKLIDDRFYHLDTCLCILNGDAALAVREAFTEEGWDVLRLKFKNLIEVPLSEAMESFAANACSIDGTNVVMQSGANATRLKLLAAGFKVHIAETSEFIKAGGSVFCLKMLF